MSDITTFARKELEHEVWRKQDYAEYYQLMHSLINIIESQQEKLDLLTEPPSEIIEFLTEGLAQKDALIESQKEEIAQLKDELKCRYGDYFSAKQKQVDSLLRMLEGNSETMQLQISEIEQKDSQIESLKAITELAVKGLQVYANEENWKARKRCGNCGYHLENDFPDDSVEYDAGGFARFAISEIARLQNG